jgi:hypothetical protein
MKEKDANSTHDQFDQNLYVRPGAHATIKPFRGLTLG